MIKRLRQYIGVVISVVGIMLLVIVTFGDMGELFTEKYWRSVGGNLSSIGAVSIGLVLIQYSIKQGVSEQALSTGLNQPQTVEKYKEHKDIVAKCRTKIMYAPYFLIIKSAKDTRRRRGEFIIDNGFTSERHLKSQNMRRWKNRRLVEKYNSIRTHITVDSIKWSPTDIEYNKYGQIEKLDVYRKKRARKGLLWSAVMMIAATFVAGGLFLSSTGVPFWQKVIKLISYFLLMAITVAFSVIKNYEKGAFGVPNELDIINDIWREFDEWKPSQRIIDEVCADSGDTDLEELNEEELFGEKGKTEQNEKTAAYGGTDVQEKQKEGESL